MMCGVLCAMLAGASRVAGHERETSPCLAADAATEEQLQRLGAVKRQRVALAAAADLEPWIERVKTLSKRAREDVVKALALCRAEGQLGPRARRAATVRLRRRLQTLDETDRQMQMMRAFEKHPRPRIDTTVFERSGPPH